MPVVSENVVKEYKRRGTSFTAVDDVSFTVEEGKITAIMGRSGSGKSTLLNILSGMIKPERGQVTIDGKNIFDESVRSRDRLRAEKIGIVPQTHSLVSGLTSYENILLQKSFASEKKESSEDSFSEIVGALDLKDLLDAYPGNLSGGEMKRVSIARALFGNLKYLFADEPTGELDKDNSKKVMDLFRAEADKGKGILIVTHDKLAADMADIVYTMENGKLRLL